MKSRIWLWSIAICLFVAFTMTGQLTGQGNPQHPVRHHLYKLYDVGTFGGPYSFGSSGAISLTPAGAIGIAQNTMPDPYAPYCMSYGNCLVGHGFWYRNGTTIDLGALPGNNRGNSSYAFAINNAGLIVGISENGAIDPATGAPSTSPVAWLNGHTFDLGGFGGTQGTTWMVNNRGQIVGASSNTTPDPYALCLYFCGTTQVRAFVWEHGVMKDIGTLGGPDANAPVISQSGLVAGQSYTSFTPNVTTGVPTLDPFLWDGRRMIDLGSLGGTMSYSNWVNNKGQVVGQSNLNGDQSTHAFLWDHGKMTDLGGLGGSFSTALWINENGDIAGDASLSDGTTSAVAWFHGQMLNLGTLPGDVYAWATSINSAKQVVGSSCFLPCENFIDWRGFIWENSGPMVDINLLMQPPSDFNINRIFQIDDRGYMVANANLPNGDVHAVVLVPMGYCDSSCEQRIAESQRNPAPARPSVGTIPQFFGKRGLMLHLPF